MLRTVKVNQKHIMKGVPRSHYSCPVALAVRGVVHEDTPVVVTRSHIILGRVADLACCDTPQAVVDFIRLFDRGQEVDQFAFDLDVPDRFLRQE